MIQRSQQLLKTTSRATRNARDWLRQADHLIQAERTPFEVIHQTGIARLRYYPPLQETAIQVGDQTVPVEPARYEIPLVIVAPLAVNMYIYDLFQHRSLVKFLTAKGFRVYMVDWGKPTSQHNHYHLSTYFADMLPGMLEQVRAHSGSQALTLHGWSFGGLFSYCYAALHNDQHIKNLALIGAPNDYHANGEIGKLYQALSKQLRWIEKRMGWKVHDSRKRYWQSPGWRNAVGFKLTNPVNSVQGYWHLIRNLDNKHFVSSHATNSAFLDRMEAYPGGVVQDFVHYLWNRNVLAHGKLPMEGAPALLHQINATIFSVVGEQDPIVTPDCSLRLLEQIPADDVTVHRVKGGHMGILGGSNAPQQSWFKLADWLAERSGERQSVLL
ncbi:MAG: alpha/beta fold hydrolase [Ketobacteraceae bacterium]|nr:alpha/beta fold hydrolase [Ketobacteraceae bacterium]